MNGRQTLDLAFTRLQAVLPGRVGRLLAWMRRPEAIWIRVPAGLLCIAASAFWYLPLVGLEWFPLGLLLLAQDLPFMRKPVGRLILFLIRQWRRLRAWWRRRGHR